ncbi:MAG: ABC transporter permease [Butyrivibrio hungatei]|nr:ABC transporter permease [Butyrivibrio hungatei]
MFGRMFIYKLKELVRNRFLIGWNFLFPLVLATAFYLGFGNMIKDDPDSFKAIDVGYVNIAGEETNFHKVIGELSEETSDHADILNVSEYTSEEEAMKDLKGEGGIYGIYVDDGNEIKTIVPFNGYRATALNQIVREYENKITLIGNIAKDHPENLDTALELVTKDMNIAKEYDFGSGISLYLQYFFALIAMASLFGSWISTEMIEGMCANHTEKGKRFECAPVSKLMSIASGVLAGASMQAVSNAIVVVYIEYVLKIEFGIPLWNVILITTLGSGLGISMGVLIGALVKNKRLFDIIPIVFSMTCSFCSGLMWDQIRQMIQANAPILNKINPAALLVDCLYTRATYGTIDVYYQDIGIMGIMIVGALTISAVLLRRRRYVSL